MGSRSPLCPPHRFQSHLFRILLLHRPSSRACRCGRPLDHQCHHRKLFRGSSLTSQVAIDATLVSSLPADGEPHRRGVDEDGAVPTIARRRKERTYPEFTGGSGRAKLVVIAGGRFSEETQTFLRLLARAKTRSTQKVLRKAPEWLLLRNLLEGGQRSLPVLLRSMREVSSCHNRESPILDGCSFGGGHGR